MDPRIALEQSDQRHCWKRRATIVLDHSAIMAKDKTMHVKNNTHNILVRKSIGKIFFGYLDAYSRILLKQLLKKESIKVVDWI
jgi:hypothetical protein